VRELSLPGTEIARLFHAEAVAPLLAREFPRLRYAAARLGSGSDVLGLDDGRSRDHDWGCRLTLLVDQPDAAAVPEITRMLERDLPETFRGFPVRFGVSWDPAVTHNVEVATVGGFAASRLGVSGGPGPSAAAHAAAPGDWSSLDWLTLTGQGALELTAGPVFHDTTGTLAALRSALAWYPPEVERYVLAAGWSRIGSELPFLGRTADRGDDLGSRVVGTRMADTLMHLAFLAERRWMPYRKWRGTVFASLPVAARMADQLAVAVTAPAWKDREDALAAAAEEVLAAQRARGLPVTDTGTVPFFDRPYRTVPGELPRLLCAGITDPWLASLPAELGSLEQWADSHEILARPHRRAALQAAYRAVARRRRRPARDRPANVTGRRRPARRGTVTETDCYLAAARLMSGTSREISRNPRPWYSARGPGFPGAPSQTTVACVAPASRASCIPCSIIIRASPRRR
jgi:hypothetical protein